MRRHVLSGCVLLAILLVCRMMYTGKATYAFLVWNIFLAWVPLAIASVSQRYFLQSWKLLLASIVWLLFFPNAPYLITDLYHLSHLAGMPLWYDALMLFIAAYTCVVMGFISLHIMEKLWEKNMEQISYFKRLAGMQSPRLILIVLLFVATGFGLYLGRVLRYNSWDIITDTSGLTVDIARRVWRPYLYFQTWGFTILYAAGLCFFYQAWFHFSNSQQENKA